MNLFEIFQNDIWIVGKQEPWCSELLNCKFRNQKTQSSASSKLGIYATPYFCFIVPCQRQCTLSHSFAFFDMDMRSGAWNLCSGEGGRSLIIGVCECDTLCDHATHSRAWHLALHDKISLQYGPCITIHYQGVPGSSVKQQPAPPSQETVLIVRERTQDC